jgi:hypothetical protein
VFILAKETGWPLQTILWDVPLMIVNQAAHVFMYMSGTKLRRPVEVMGNDLRDMERALGL